MNQFEEIYETMLGIRIPEAQIPGVEDAFAEGELCDLAYGQMRKAYLRICARLGSGEEDADLDEMVFQMERIQEELCRRMYRQKRG